MQSILRKAGPVAKKTTGPIKRTYEEFRLIQQNRRRRKKAYEDRVAELTRQALVDRFPDTFGAKDQPKRPLKFDIHLDLIEACPDIGKWRIKGMLKKYTNDVSYLESVVIGATRIDLTGCSAGIVSDEGAKFAARKLARIRSEEENTIVGDKQ